MSQRRERSLDRDQQILDRLAKIEHKVDSIEQTNAFALRAEADKHFAEVKKIFGKSIRRAQVYLAADGARSVQEIAQHLSMAHIAERRDLDDERLIIEFARLVGDEDLLKMLYLLSYLDISAVGPQVWTDWKGTLLWELFIKTHTILTRGVPEGEEEQRKAANLRSAFVAELGPEFGAEVVRQLENGLGGLDASSPGFDNNN
jgi:hypothetical protein